MQERKEKAEILHLKHPRQCVPTKHMICPAEPHSSPRPREILGPAATADNETLKNQQPITTPGVSRLQVRYDYHEGGVVEANGQSDLYLSRQ